jgi:hypothetical protein
MTELAEHDRAKAIHLLDERLVFERASVKLYDRVLGELRAFGADDLRGLEGELVASRNEEVEHLAWLEGELRALRPAAGGAQDASAADAARRMEEVADGDVPLPQLVNTLLAAKLADDAGWIGLVQLAGEAGDVEARRELRRRLHEEEDHLALIRRVMEKLLFTEVLAEEAAPGAPH